MNKFGARVALIGLLLTYFALGMVHATHASITFDEGPHLAVGYTTLRTGDLRLQPVHIHPPLANVLAAAPLLLQGDLPDPRAVDGWEIASLSAITDTVVWQYPEPARIAVAGRVPILWLGVLLGALIYRWAKDLGGWRAGLLALALYAFDPNCIAHGSLITTDMAAVFFIVATLYVAKGEGRRGNGTWRMAAIGVLIGLAQVAKVSALMLAPVVGLLLLVQAGARLNHESRIMNHEARMTSHVSRITFRVLRAWLIVFGIAALVVWAGYGFEISAVPGFPLPLPAATHLRIFQALRDHYDVGHPTFLMGRISSHGWWWYFPVAFVLKTPLPVLILAVWAVWSKVKSQSGNLPPSKVGSDKAYSWVGIFSLCLFPLLYVASSLFSSVNIGYRHLLPLLPFLYIGIGVGIRGCGLRIMHHVSRIAHHVLRMTPYLLLLTWLIIGTIGIAPHFLTFFNEIAGGAREGYRYLVDSNLDWGQNLWDLRAWMDEHGEEHVYYAHYSPARLDVYGIDADFLPPDPRAVAFAPWHPAPGLYAIGATVLQGPYMPDANTYAWFRGREPVARLGHALWLYRVSPREAPAWAALCGGVPVSAEAVPAKLGVQDVRLLWLDCASVSVYPVGAQPGVIVTGVDDLAPSAAETDVALQTSTGEIQYVVYRLSGPAPTPEMALAEIAIEGPLDFLGYTLDADGAAPGGAVVLQTYWRVREPPGRPLSLLAHLLGPDGAGVAVGDGLGFPVEQWRPGDVIVQRHILSIPPIVPAGTYTLTTGAYWLDTMERWVVGAGETHIVVEGITVGD
ncbi:MAG: phospholipid carrier-dependent glycosyltransferase [Anaerolineae bacterium]|nr:phospholipid carrier-dependent glycosyltransferase [Anaerolineae bacterium]